MLTSFPLLLPPKDTQRKIGAILSAYDDLIENNTRRSAILEEMTRALYREWFVDFRFPGHGTVKLVSSSLGLIPEGWEPAAFTDIADILSGGTPNTLISEYWNGDIPWFTPGDVTESFYAIRTKKYVTQQGVNNCASGVYPVETVFITARGTVGKLVLGHS